MQDNNEELHLQMKLSLKICEDNSQLNKKIDIDIDSNTLIDKTTLEIEKIKNDISMAENFNNKDQINNNNIKTENAIYENEKNIHRNYENLPENNQLNEFENDIVTINSNSEYALKSDKLLNNIKNEIKDDYIQNTDKNDKDKTEEDSNLLKIDNFTIKLNENLGKGSFGHVFKAIDDKSKINLAVKIESKSTLVPQLEHEYKIFCILSEINLSNISSSNQNNNVTYNTFSNSLGGTNTNLNKIKLNLNGIPIFYLYKSLGNFNLLFMEEFAYSLEDLLKIYKKFTLKTIINISYQLVSILL